MRAEGSRFALFKNSAISSTSALYRLLHRSIAINILRGSPTGGGQIEPMQLIDCVELPVCFLLKAEKARNRGPLWSAYCVSVPIVLGPIQTHPANPLVLKG